MPPANLPKKSGKLKQVGGRRHKTSRWREVVRRCSLAETAATSQWICEEQAPPFLLRVAVSDESERGCLSGAKPGAHDLDLPCTWRSADPTTLDGCLVDHHTILKDLYSLASCNVLIGCHHGLMFARNARVICIILCHSCQLSCRVRRRPRHQK